MGFVPWVLKTFNNIKLIEQPLQSISTVKIVITHSLINIGQINQCHKLNKELAF